jgi:excisionase family DNA binding protein
MTGVDDRLRPLLVNAKQAARLLGIGRTTLYELIGASAITPVHVGRCVRFSMIELERFVADGCVVDIGRRPAPKPDRADPRPRPARGVQANAPTLQLFDPAG